MNALRMAFVALILSAPGLHASDPVALLQIPRQRLETADYRASGHLVRVDASGARTSLPLSIKAHGFPGVFRVLVEIGAPSNGQRDVRRRLLIEMRLQGETTIRIAAPGDTSPRTLPFDSWDTGLSGSGFTYEDFLEQQYFWPHQTSLGEKTFGARTCQVILSRPGASDRTHYAEVTTWLDPSIGFPVYAEKTLKDSGAVKQFTYLGLRREGGQWSASQIEVKTRGQPGSTLLMIDRGSAKANLKLDDFNPGKLTRF